MPATASSVKPQWVQQATQLAILLEGMVTSAKPKRPHGWATRAKHYPTYAYLAGLLERLQSALGIGGPVYPDDWRQGADERVWKDDGVMLLAQQVGMLLDLYFNHLRVCGAENEKLLQRLLAAVISALKETTPQP